MGKSGAVGQRQIARAIDGIPCHALEDTTSRIDVPGCSSSSIEIPEQSRTATSLTPIQDGGWTAEKLATLRQLWQAGLSARQIARKLPGFNRTRSPTRHFASAWLAAPLRPLGRHGRSTPRHGLEQKCSLKQSFNMRQ